MSDDRRRRRAQPWNSLIASAALVDLSRGRDPLPAAASWEDEAWSYYDDGFTPEVGFATRYLSNALSRCRLVAALPGVGGGEPIPLESGPAVEMVEALAGGMTGQSQLLAAAAPQLAIPGQGYLVGEPFGSEETGAEGPATFRVLSRDEVSTTNVAGGRRYVVQEGEGSSDKRVLAPDAVAVRFWRPHHRFHWRADSPIRGALGVLRELKLLSQDSNSAALSRLSGRGVWVIPSEVSFPVPPEFADAPDPLLAMYHATVAASIANPEAPEAQSPIIFRVPGDQVANFQHFTFDTPQAARAAEDRMEAIRRFATAFDLPAEVVLGLAESNHWTAWQIEESAQKLHVEPTLEALCHSITVGYLTPGLEAMGVTGEQADAIVWFDSSELSSRPDRSENAKELFDRGAIGFRALRREAGFDEGDIPEPEEDQRRLALDALHAAPGLLPVLAPLLGLDLDFPDEDPLITGRRGDPGPQDIQGPADGPPARPTEPPSNAPEAAAEAGLLAACDGLVDRAMEVAGRRLSNLARREGVTDLPEDPRLVHVRVPEARNAEWMRSSLAGAWVRLPEVAARYDAEASAVADALDAYVEDLILSGTPHSWDRMAVALGASDG